MRDVKVFRESETSAQCIGSAAREKRNRTNILVTKSDVPCNQDRRAAKLPLAIPLQVSPERPTIPGVFSPTGSHPS